MQRSKPEALRPDQSRSEGTPSLSEWAERRSKPFGLPFRRLEKVTRRKGETASRRTRSNGYSLSQPERGRLSGRHRWQASSHNEMKSPTKTQATKNPQTITHLRVSRSSGKKIRNPPAATPHKPASRKGDSTSKPPPHHESTRHKPQAQPSIPRLAQPAPPHQ